MSAEIPAAARRLFTPPNVAQVATVMPDGSPHVSPVWVELAGDRVRFNSARGLVKVRNLERDPRVALAVVDQADPDLFVMVRGRAAITEEGAVEHVHHLARAYTGEPYVFVNDRTRVLIEVRPEHVFFNGEAS